MTVHDEGTTDFDRALAESERGATPVPLPTPPPPVGPSGGREYDGPKVQVRQRAAVPGDHFLFGEADDTVPIWGSGHDVLWSQGEPFQIAGPQGTGKSTLGQNLTLARLGIIDSLLGYPVVPGKRRTVYMAMDRPRQIRRSLRRMVNAQDHLDVLHHRLVVWQGPPPFDLLAPGGRGRFAEWVVGLDADTLVIDSLKDLAPGMSKEEVGVAVNNEIQEIVVNDVEVLTLQHPRKRNADNKSAAPTLDDIYGSTFLTAGHGSVCYLHGAAGDAFIKLIHLKQPDEMVGPLDLLHDQTAGNVTVQDTADPLTVLRAASRGLTARGLAEIITGSPDPDRSAVARASRRLESLVAAKKAHKNPGTKGGQGGGTPATYHATDGRRLEAL